jgi:ABC-2 type transport system permease protein
MNSVTFPTPVVDEAPVQGMSRARLLRAYFIDVKYEFIRLLRNTQILIPVLLLPVVVYPIFGVGLVNSFDERTLTGITTREILELMFVNLSIFSILGPSMATLGTVLASERESGLFTYRRALPMPPLAPLLAKALVALLVISVLMVALTVEAIVFARLDFTFAQYLGVWATCLVGALPFCAIGLYLGARVSGAAAHGVVTGAYMAMAMVGGLLFPLPPAFAWIALFSPTFYLSQLAFGAAGMRTLFDPAFPVALLLVVTVVFTWLAMRRLMRAS